MRFTDRTGLGQIIRYSGQRLLRVLTVPITTVYRKVRRILNPNGFSTRVISDVRKAGRKLVMAKPQSLKDYFAIGNWYVAKKVVYIALLLLFVLPILYLKFLHPIVRSNWLTERIVVNSAEMMGYTGKVELLGSANGPVLYEGRLENGRINGAGKLYDYQGRLCYEGGFAMEQYEGEGQSFFSDGKVQYTGGFSKNLYNGQGTLNDQNGKLLYQGEFKDGKYEGQGTLYQNGMIFYQGSFQAGQMQGEGKLYAGTQVVYEGGFASGRFEGAGREYDPIRGRLLYDGTYADGQYQGTGKQFDPTSGVLVYEGGFYQGEYQGEGKLYHTATQLLRYEGGFRQGRYDGTGIKYDSTLAVPVYEGEFVMGTYHGAGKEYDAKTGFVTVSGQYRNGKLVELDEKGKVIGAVEAPTLPVANNTTPGGTTPGGTTPAGTTPGGTTPAGTTPGGTTPAGTTPGGTTPGNAAYTGPATADGKIDFAQLAKLPEEQLQNAFSGTPTGWSLNDGAVQIYNDKAGGIGVALRKDGTGKLVSVDVWNDAPVLQGAKVGMTSEQLSSVLGQPTETTEQTMGEARMVSVSQSNRYFGRLTNLSPQSTMTVRRYQTANGTVQAVFDPNSEACILLEVLP